MNKQLKQTGDCQRGGELEYRAKRLGSTNWQSQNSPRNVKYSIRNIVNNNAITIYGFHNYGARWILEILGRTVGKVYDCLTTMLYTEANAK